MSGPGVGELSANSEHEQVSEIEAAALASLFVASRFQLRYEEACGASLHYTSNRALVGSAVSARNGRLCHDRMDKPLIPIIAGRVPTA
jgi:hypothetical protein